MSKTPTTNPQPRCPDCREAVRTSTLKSGRVATVDIDGGIHYCPSSNPPLLSAVIKGQVVIGRTLAELRRNARATKADPGEGG